MYFGMINQVCSQVGFELPKNQKRDNLIFRSINNLVVIPVEVNGTPLSFLLDTGVSNTIIFSLTSEDSLQINNTVPVKIRGLGAGETINALKSGNNTVKVGDAIDTNHSLYLIFDETLNFSPRMGIPVHGIIGYDFFKKFIVKTNYLNERITFYRPEKYTKKRCRKCEVFDLTFNKNKPYVDVELQSDDSTIKSLHLLLDSGSSDAIWLFEEEKFISDIPKNYFDDFLGLGLSGNIYGKRSRLDKVKLGTFELNDVNVAFPEDEAVETARYFKKRGGSLGGAFLKRFISVIDYPNKRIILRKNGNFNDPFTYDMSGLTLEHDGLEMVRRPKKKVSNLQYSGTSKESGSYASSDISVVTEYEFVLVPRFVVAEIRKNSPAALAGIETGSEILEINGKPAHHYELFEINELFSSKEGKKILLRISQGGKVFKVRFELKKVL
jgi:hypothetical protein